MSDTVSLTQWLRRNTLCRLGMCGCITGGNDTHLWAECVRCGRKSSVLSRDTMRAYMEKQDEHERRRCLRSDGA